MWERYLAICDDLVVVVRRDREVYSVEEAQRRFRKAPSAHIHVRFIENPRASFRNFFSKALKHRNEAVLDEEIAKADGVIIRTFSSASVSFFLHTVAKYKKKYLYECIGHTWDAMWNYGWRGKVLAPFSYYHARRLAARADRVLYVTEKFLQKHYPSDAPQIGVSDVDIPPCTEDILQQRLAKIREPHDKIVLGTTAAIDVSYKGQEFVIRAIGKLKRQGDTRFIYQMAGTGDKARLLRIAEQEGVSSQIEFLGALPHDGVLKWLHSIDIYVQPSLLEGLPRALVEAMSTALPAAATCVGGIPELLPDSSMFPRKDVSRLVDRLKDLADPGRMEQEARRNFERAKHYEHDKVDARRSKFYKDFDNDCMQIS